MEYWIDDSGTEIYCDGDAGVDVPNHAMVIATECAHRVRDALHKASNRFCEAIADIIEANLVDSVIDCTKIRCEINDLCDGKDWDVEPEALDDTYTYIRKITGFSEEITRAAFGDYHDGNFDPRELGLSWGWIRVIGNNFQVKELNRTICHRMANFAAEHESEDNTWRLEVIGEKGFWLDSLTCDELESPAKIRRIALTANKGVK